MSKKVVIILVEGITDQAALEGVLKTIYNPDEIVFKIIMGDITSDNKTTPQNMKKKITSLIKSVIERYYINKSDILKVIHFVDLDGAYIKDSDILEDPNATNFVYTDDNIIYSSKNKAIQRNAHKRNNLNLLSSLKKVFKDLDYFIYYFSCDQEHVLHNRRKVLDHEKDDLAEAFNDKYGDDLEGFKEFILDPELAAPGDYKESWEFIKLNRNSLNRHSNFHLLLEK